MHVQIWILIIMMQGNTIKLLKRIDDLPGWRRKPRIHWYSLQLARADINACTFLDVPEIDGIEGAALVGNHWWFHVAEESPLSGSEEGVGFDV
jgi:hypothetical protein